MAGVLITGAGGFVGRHLARSLAARGAEVHGFGLGPIPDDTPSMRWREGDVLDRDAVDAAVAGARPDAVVHLAGQSSAWLSFERPLETYRANAMGTWTLLDAVRRHAPQARILVVGTGEAYGPQPEGSRVGEDAPFRPVSPYALSKAAADALSAAFARRHGLAVIRTRSFGHTGPGQAPTFVVSSFARQIARIEAGAGDGVLRVGNLEVTRDISDVRDVVSATRYLTDVREQDDLNRVWAQYLGGHLPTTTTVEVSRLATHPRCKLEITAIAVSSEEIGGTRYAVYNLHVQPDLWPMTKDRNFRIFQEQTVPQIVKTLLAEHNVQLEDQLTGDYRLWGYCVQYNESSFNFNSRLMELEGLKEWMPPREEGYRSLVAALDADLAPWAAGQSPRLKEIHTSDPDEFFSVPIDVLVVATPATSHMEYLAAGLEAGIRRFMVEKPVASRLADADTALERARQVGARVVVNHTRRYSERHRRLRHLAESGALGELRGISITTGAGGTATLGTHYFDLCNYLFGGGPRNVAAALTGDRDPNPRGTQFHDPGATALLLYSDERRASVEIAGPGFINMKVADTALSARAAEVAQDTALAGASAVETPRRVVIDYAGPNVAKPMHVGHVRSTILGDCLARVLRLLGHRVITDNHLGDWGTQFGMLLYGYEQFQLAEPCFERAHRRLFRRRSRRDISQRSASRLPGRSLSGGPVPDHAASRGLDGTVPKVG